MNNIKLISFLTLNDKTVNNAKEIFDNCKDVEQKYWGFKNTGISKDYAFELLKLMKKSEKSVFYESLEENEEKALEDAKFAVENDIDYLIGMPYSDVVGNFIKDKSTKFFPTCGKRSVSLPRKLLGTIDEVIEDGLRIQDKGVSGICLSVYRFEGGNPEELAKRFIDKLNIPVIISGSVNCYERLDFVKELKPWGFTLGSGFFKKSFSDKLGFKNQLISMVEYLKKI